MSGVVNGSDNGAMEAEQKPPVLCIVGPTAAGKSQLAVELAQQLDTEVVSADSMQVYRGMDIGTAKMTPAEMGGVRHHLLDIVDPDEPFTVADWTERADDVIARLHRLGKLPIVVGGTGLYIRAITTDLDFGEQPGNDEVREKWRQFARHYGPERLHAELTARDVESAKRLHPNDVKRVIRALEVYETRGTPLSTDYDWSQQTGRYAVVSIGLQMHRARLYERIDQRVLQMIQAGWLDEVQHLYAQGYDDRLTSMQAIGYRELLDVVRGRSELADVVPKIQQATRRFAKRQLSWFRRDSRTQWMELDAPATEWMEEKQRILEYAGKVAAGIGPSYRE